jgi:uncharacterized membrane protein YuzA (DUF378 family)
MFLSEQLYKVAIVIALIGAINWGLVGIFKWDAVQWISKIVGSEAEETVKRVLYVIVGIAGVALVFEKNILQK